MKGEKLELKVEDLAYQGKAIAKLNSLVIFLDGGIPGDVVYAKIVKIKPNYMVASIEEILQKSPFRTEPVCRHFGMCGGCRLQDLKYEEQLKFKTKQVKESINHIALLENSPVEDALASPDLFYYRNKMEFSFNRSDENETILGLHQSGSYDKSFNLEECFLQSEASNRIVRWTRDFVRQKELVPYNIKTHEGFLRYLMIREAKSSGQMMVNLVTSSAEWDFSSEFSEGLRRESADVVSIVQNINPHLANIAFGERQVVLYGEDAIFERIGEFNFRISSNSFFQTNTRQAERLYRLILDLARLQGKEEVLDLYCGTGTISVFLSKSAGKVVGVESMQNAVRDAEENAKLNQVRNCDFVCSDVRGFLKESASQKNHIELAVLDPPRAGLSPKTVKYLLGLDVPRVIYVSCNPATLSRDLRFFLDSGYDLRRVCPIDMFPHTFHIEVVSLLEKKD